MKFASTIFRKIYSSPIILYIAFFVFGIWVSLEAVSSLVSVENALRYEKAEYFFKIIHLTLFIFLIPYMKLAQNKLKKIEVLLGLLGLGITWFLLYHILNK